jgi:hypothetical protein
MMTDSSYYHLRLRGANESSSRLMLADGAELHQFIYLCGAEADAGIRGAVVDLKFLAVVFEYGPCD